ncbi:MAG: hypothetical protein IJ664_06265 [Clostridia bacterium]|nr:hypothetical protein [Clostridia bacterium]
MKLLRLLTACAVCLLMLACAAWAEISLEAELGYENTVTYIRAVPLRVTLKNDGADASLTVAVNVSRSDREYDRYEYPVFLAGSAEMRLTLPINITYKQSAFTVEVLSGGETVASAAVKPQKVVSPDTLLVGLLSSQPQSMRYLNINSSADPLMRGEYWQTLALTAETFPEDVELLRSFPILAIDDFDLSTLSDRQRGAFDQWLRQGGIVLSGGGSSGISTFRGLMGYTGIVTGTPTRAERVDKALISGLSQGQFVPVGLPSLNGSVMLSQLRGSRGAVMEMNGEALLDRRIVENGVVYTAAFSLSERPLSAWSGMNGFWQRVLLTFDQPLYQQVVRRVQNYYDTGDNAYVDSWLLRKLPMENPDSVLLVVLLIGGFVVLSGIGSYLILKRLDKREWMWLTVPALSLLSAIITLSLSRSMQLGRPAVAAYARIQVAENGASQSRVLAGVASSARVPLTVAVTTGDSILPGNTDYSYYDDRDEEQQNIQPTLRYTYSYGDQMSLTLPAGAPWEVQTLTLTPSEEKNYPIHAATWWEQDGLHGTVENGSDLTLEPGFIITQLGFCRVPALQPGESASFAILENPGRVSDPNDYNVYEGELVKNANMGFYNIIDAAIYGPRDANGNRLEKNFAPDFDVKSSLIQSCSNTWGNAPFRYVTFSDQTPMPVFEMNGEPIRRTAYGAVIDVQIGYRAVSRSGIVKLTPGMIPAYYAEVTSADTPVSNGIPVTEGYFPLRDEPVLCFALGEIKDLDLSAVELTSVSFHCESYGSQAHLQLYNSSRKAWQEVAYSAFPASLPASAVPESLDDAGRLFVRLTPYNAASGGEIYNPGLSLEGRAQ